MPFTTAFNHTAVKSGQYRKTNGKKNNKKRTKSIRATHKSRTFLGGVLWSKYEGHIGFH